MYSCTHVLTVDADEDLPGEGDGGVGLMYLSKHVPMYSCTHVTHVLTVEADVDLSGEGDGGVGVGGLANKLPAQVLPLQQEGIFMVAWRS